MAKELSLNLEANPAVLALVRERIRAEFGDRLPAPFLHDLNVVVTELVGNSVEHGPGEAIQLRLVLAEDGMVRGEVADSGNGKVAIREMSDDPSEALGLRIVDWLTDRWAVSEGSTNVWFEMSAARSAPAPRSGPAQPV